MQRQKGALLPQAKSTSEQHLRMRWSIEQKQTRTRTHGQPADLVWIVHRAERVEDRRDDFLRRELRRRHERGEGGAGDAGGGLAEGRVEVCGRRSGNTA